MIIWYILCSLQFYELRNNKQLSISMQYIPTFREFIQIKFFKFKFLKKKWTKTFLFVIYHTNENIFIMLFCCQIFKELKIWISNHCSNIFLEKILHFKFIQWEYYFKSFNACAILVIIKCIKKSFLGDAFQYIQEKEQCTVYTYHPSLWINPTLQNN